MNSVHTEAPQYFAARFKLSNARPNWDCRPPPWKIIEADDEAGARDRAAEISRGDRDNQARIEIIARPSYHGHWKTVEVIRPGVAA